MRFLSIVLFFMMCIRVYADTVPPSPAGGGYFEIYNPGDYAFIPDHDDFDANFQESGAFTIEFWFYMKRIMKPYDKMRIEPSERWNLINKSGSYNIYISFIADNVIFKLRSSIVGDSNRKVDLPINQWHYVAFTVNIYRQKIINQNLRGAAKLGRTIFIGVLDSSSSLRIGGGVPAPVGVIPNEPFFEQPFWTPFTGGLIDEIRISNINRYPRENLDQEYWKGTIDVPTGPFEPDEHTVALWHFDFDGTHGSKWRDASGNGHHLTYSGNYLNVEPYGKLATTWAQLKSNR